MMDRDVYADMFQFAMGQGVRWAGQPTARYTIAQRRFTERDGLAPVVEYLLYEHTRREEVGIWAYEPDLTP